MHVSRRSRHCSFCEVCISDHDHHCVFIGKCVGGRNMGTFKMFLVMVFATMMYGLASSLLNLEEIKRIHREGGK